MKFWLEKNGERVLPVLVCDGDKCAYRERIFAAVLLARRLERGVRAAQEVAEVEYNPYRDWLFSPLLFAGNVTTEASGSIERLKLYGYEYKEEADGHVG